jgi:hypothetical protein
VVFFRHCKQTVIPGRDYDRRRSVNRGRVAHPLVRLICFRSSWLDRSTVMRTSQSAALIREFHHFGFEKRRAVRVEDTDATFVSRRPYWRRVSLTAVSPKDDPAPFGYTTQIGTPSSRNSRESSSALRSDSRDSTLVITMSEPGAAHPLPLRRQFAAHPTSRLHITE